MSRPRYAPITSSLLVRKGRTTPTDAPHPEFFDFVPPAFAEPVQHVLEREDEDRIQAEYEKWMRERELPRVSHAHHGHADNYPRRCTIRLTHSEYERLGIVAVKKDITRQQALRQAVERYLAAAKRQFRSHCSCLGGECDGTC